MGLYDILPALGPKPSEALLGRLLDALHHHHQVPPLHRIAVGLLIILRQFETSRLQTLDIHHHTAILSMQQLHQLAAGTDEDEDITVAHVALHPFMHHATQRTDALAHVSPTRAQVVAHRVIQAEHDR